MATQAKTEKKVETKKAIDLSDAIIEAVKPKSLAFIEGGKPGFSEKAQKISDLLAKTDIGYRNRNGNDDVRRLMEIVIGEKIPKVMDVVFPGEVCKVTDKNPSAHNYPAGELVLCLGKIEGTDNVHGIRQTGVVGNSITSPKVELASATAKEVEEMYKILLALPKEKKAKVAKTLANIVLDDN